ncbi:uncharacterized protein LOC135206895 [Macrobrachium nipponense]|uniref:uncharacterized protein LOC135206895 n=1 Tax=Macrobrachium nipponense TaxID=159736 RepID=UPI0030C829DC
MIMKNNPAPVMQDPSQEITLSTNTNALSGNAPAPTLGGPALEDRQGFATVRKKKKKKQKKIEPPATRFDPIERTYLLYHKPPNLPPNLLDPGTTSPPPHPLRIAQTPAPLPSSPHTPPTPQVTPLTPASPKTSIPARAEAAPDPTEDAVEEEMQTETPTVAPVCLKKQEHKQRSL